MTMTLDAPAALSGDEPISQVVVSTSTDEVAIAGKIGDETEQGETETEQSKSEVETPDSETEQANDETTNEPVADDKPAGELIAADVPKVEIDEADFWTEIKLIGQLVTAERECQMADNQLASLKGEVKEAKERCDTALIRLRYASSNMLDQVNEKALPKLPQPAIADSKAAEAEGDNAWRNVPTTELLAGLKGMGKKKLESLIDVAPTSGHLEDLRGEASKAYMSFKEMLPAGFGGKIADAIEERLIDCVAAASPSAAEQLAEQQAAEADEEIESSELAEESKAEDAEEPKEADQSAEDEPETVHEFYEKIKGIIWHAASDDATKEDFIPDDLTDTDDSFVVGFNAHASLPYVGCPVNGLGVFDRDWMIGWLHGEIVEGWGEPHDALDVSNESNSDEYEDVEDSTEDSLSSL